MDNSMPPPTGMEGLAATITEGYHTLKQVTCLEDVYDILDFLADEVKHYYPHIRCKIDCAQCCKGMHPPYISAIEWELILYYISEFPQIIKDEIVRRARFYAAEYRDALSIQHRLIKGQIPAAEIQESYQTLALALKSASCPFLVMDKCGIYPVRPAKCRSMGNTLVKINDTVKVHTCAWEISNFETYLTEQNQRSLTMPLWNIFDQVMDILNPPHSLKAVIPIWLITHIRGNELLEEVEPNPEVLL